MISIAYGLSALLIAVLSLYNVIFYKLTQQETNPIMFGVLIIFGMAYLFLLTGDNK